MTNLTVQQIYNRGFYPVDAKQISVTTSATQITAPANPCNAIVIKSPADLSGGARIFLGTSGVTTGNGYPLYSYAGSAGATVTNQDSGLFILTGTPTSFYLIANVGPVNCSVLYLAYNVT